VTEAILTEFEYFGHLEMRVSRELAGMRDWKLRSMSCDGFIPEDVHLVGRRCRISGSVWMAFGQERQKYWSFALHLGTARPREQIDWPASLPAENLTGWLSLDFTTKFMKVNPLAARVDGEPGKLHR